MFCMSLIKAENRATFKADEASYLVRFSLTADQRRAVLERGWNDMLDMGGNVYYLAKLAATDGLFRCASLGRHGVGPRTPSSGWNLAEITGGTPSARLGPESIAHATRPKMSSPSRFQSRHVAQITNALIAGHKQRAKSALIGASAVRLVLAHRQTGKTD
jgi:Aromatic-ring-opening dioxygenase LigAB, LigA subunit